MPLTYEQAVAKLQDTKAFPEGPDMLEALQEKVHSVNQEAANVRQRSKAHETKATRLTEALRAVGLDPDKDVNEQFEQLLTKKLAEKTVGYKGPSEMEAAIKQATDEVRKEMKAARDADKAEAEKARQEARIEKAKSAFLPKMIDVFGDNAALIFDHAQKLLGLITVVDGVSGTLEKINGVDEFTPLEVAKGKNAIDVLKEKFPKLIITKQNPGSGRPGSRSNQGNGEPEKEQMTRKEHDALSLSNPKAAREFVKKIGEKKAEFVDEEA